MKFSGPISLGTLIRRYKRFLADVRLDTGETVTAHVANTGSMRGCADPGLRVALSHHPGKGRKLPYSLELVRVNGTWVGVNTSRSNAIVEEAARQGRIPALRGYNTIRREVRYGVNSRIDLLLSHPDAGTPPCYVEVKNVTLRLGNAAAFPDAVTARGRKHLMELRNEVRQGHRAVMLFLVNRDDCEVMRPAAEIDPAYAATLLEVVGEGVEPVAVRARATPVGIEVVGGVPFLPQG